MEHIDDTAVLIESDWNLKQGSFNIYSNVAMLVLIESDWNLKKIVGDNFDMSKASINRIRLEFKAVLLA